MPLQLQECDQKPSTMVPCYSKRNKSPNSGDQNKLPKEKINA